MQAAVFAQKCKIHGSSPRILQQEKRRGKMKKKY
jgi:hypothetical protein